LFGSGFTEYLKDELEADSSLVEVVSLSQCYNPYSSSNASTCQSTIGKTSFFEGDLPGSGDFGRVITGPHQVTLHFTSQGGVHLKNQGDRTNLSQTIIPAKGTIELDLKLYSKLASNSELCTVTILCMYIHKTTEKNRTRWKPQTCIYDI